MQPDVTRVALPWARVDRSGGPDACWPWTGAHVPHGYGKVARDGRFFYTHRLAWESANGPVPPGLSVLHSCDNPPCCNPAHLFVGTMGDNIRDAVAKGRHRTGAPAGKGEANRNALLTDAAVVAIRRGHAEGVRSMELQKRYGVSRATILRVINHQAWTHI